MKLISFILILCSLSQSAFANCDYAKDIVKIDTNKYTYSLDCHLLMGTNIKKIELMTQEELDLKKAIDAQKEALNLADERTQNWLNTAIAQNESLNKVEHLQNINKTLYFTLGVLTTILAVFAAGQIYKH